ncbi:MAG: tetratricopeptide repeat protein [Chloroflexi bacterium]|nr:tetratricopeptide repeat protein [Chloroflexota bacterium]
MATLSSPAFGDLLRRYRMAAGLTQEELAERAGLSVRAISDLERGTRHVPRKGTMQLLLEALPVSERERGELEAAARRMGGAAPIREGPDRRPHALAQPPTLFVGRERETAAVQELLRRPQVRLLTLTGPGGIGKTRLALRVAASLADDFPDGVCAVSLASLSHQGPGDGDGELVASAIAEAAGVREGGGQTLADTLKGALRDRRLLLVLDNFEHLLPASSLVADLLESCPGLTVLVSSRAVLRLSGERTFEVPPLAVPVAGSLPGLEAIGRCEAVTLFCDRAQAAKADFTLTGENAGAVVEICRRLDGLPLAIELAASRSRLLPPRALLAQLSGRLGLLTGGARDAPDRHRTLRGAIEWSYTLLDEGERGLFARLSVFAGGCTLTAAEAVCQAGGDLSYEVLDGLSSLVDRSLLRAEEQEMPGGYTEPRFAMLETIREYALEWLATGGEAEALRRGHAAYFLALAEEAEPHLLGPAQVAWLARLEADLDNLRAAMRWALDGGDRAIGLRLAAALWRFWYARGHLSEGRRWLERLLGPAEGDEMAGWVEAEGPVAARALIWASALAADQGDYGRATTLAEKGLTLSRLWSYPWGVALALSVLGKVALNRSDDGRAEALYEGALDLFRQLGDRWGICLSLNNLGMVGVTHGDLGRAAILYGESLVIGREAGDLWSIAVVLDNLGEVMHEQGEHGQAIALHEESLALRRELGDIWGIADCLCALGRVARLQGDEARAARLYEESLALYRRVGDTWRSAVCLEGLGGIAHGRGRMEEAARLFGAASALRERIGHPLSSAERPLYDRDIAGVRLALGEEAFAAAWAVGRTMSPARQRNSEVDA